MPQSEAQMGEVKEGYQGYLNGFWRKLFTKRHYSVGNCPPMEVPNSFSVDLGDNFSHLDREEHDGV